MLRTLHVGYFHVIKPAVHRSGPFPRDFTRPTFHANRQHGHKATHAGFPRQSPWPGLSQLKWSSTHNKSLSFIVSHTLVILPSDLLMLLGSRPLNTKPWNTLLCAHQLARSGAQCDSGSSKRGALLAPQGAAPSSSHGTTLFEQPTRRYPKQGAGLLLKHGAAIQGAPTQRCRLDIRRHYFTERTRAVSRGLRAPVKPVSLEVLTRESPERPGVIPELTLLRGQGWTRDLRFPPVLRSYPNKSIRTRWSQPVFKNTCTQFMLVPSHRWLKGSAPSLFQPELKLAKSLPQL